MKNLKLFLKMILTRILRKKDTLSGCIRNDGQTQGPKKLQMTLDWDNILSWVLKQHLVVSKEGF